MPGDKPQYPPFENVSGAYLDERLQAFVIITKDLLINQLSRDCPKIAVSFDEATNGELGQISEVVAFTYTMLAPHILGADLEDKARGATCARLLNTALTTFLGCVHLARGGFRVQYMTLSRSVVETFCTVLHLMIEPNAIQAFHDGTLKSTRSISAATRVIPLFGRFWGELSNQFVHINTLHSGLNSITSYKSEDEDLHTMVINMRILAWLSMVTAELVFIEDIGCPRYWRIVERRADGNAVKFDPSPEERQWQAKFFGMEEIDLGA